LRNHDSVTPCAEGFSRHLKRDQAAPALRQGARPANMRSPEGLNQRLDPIPEISMTTPRLATTYRRALIAAAASVTLLLSACASDKMIGAPDTAPVKTSNGMLIGLNGMTLYTFDRDSVGNGKSACNGNCAVLWPALKTEATAGKGDFTVITRDDASKQWAYKGAPLYYFSKDVKPGDATGDGFANGIWHVAKP
jgi:predicted lipoprotein with Yx(FWY)xxD motif